MQHLNTLTQLMNAASTVGDLARKHTHYQFAVQPGSTLYVHIAGAVVRLERTAGSNVEIEAELQAPFAWRVAAEQDDAGVYFVALRRPLVSGLAAAEFRLGAPAALHVILRLSEVELRLAGVSGEFEFPPVPDGRLIIQQPQSGR